jgi:hypothetical protein
MNPHQTHVLKEMVEAAYGDYKRWCFMRNQAPEPYEEFVDNNSAQIYNWIIAQMVVALESTRPDQRSIYMARRNTGQKPVVASRLGQCVQCGHEVWLDSARIDQQQECDIVCNECTAELTGGLSHADIMNMVYQILGIKEKE